MDKYFYIDSNGVQKGPVDVDQLKRLGLPPYTLIWKKGMREWSEFSTLIAVDSKKTTETATQERRQTSQTPTTATTATSKYSTTSTSSAATLSSAVNKPTTKTTSSNDKSGQSKTTDPEPYSRNTNKKNSRRRRRNQSKTWAIIQIILILVVCFPSSIYFRIKTKETAAVEGLTYTDNTNVGEAAMNVCLFITLHWPFIALAIAEYFALSSYFNWSGGGDDDLFISIIISIGTLILGALMMCFPTVVFYIILTVLVIALTIAFISANA